MDKEKLLELFDEDKRERFNLLSDMLIRLVQDQSALQKIVDEQGYTYQTPDFIKPNPAVAQLRETQKQILTLSARFGLSPRDLQLLERDQTTQTQAEDFSEFGDLNE